MIGIDIIQIGRIDKLLTRKNFFKKFFTENELEFIKNRNYNKKTIAGLIATKEALLKALKIGLFSGLSFNEIEILHDDTIPYISKYGKLEKFMEEKNILTFEISISHDFDYAVSVVFCIKG